MDWEKGIRYELLECKSVGNCILKHLLFRIACLSAFS